MKKNYLKLIVLIVFASNLFAQNIPSYVPKDGLVGWWPFNGNANDESGNGNHGTVNGATLTADRNGKVNSAYSFDGISDYIKLSADKLPVKQFTISVWFYSNTLCDCQKGRRILGIGGQNCGNSLLMILDNGGNLDGQNAYQVNSHCNIDEITSVYGDKIPNGKWNNWIITQSDTNSTFFVNGNLILNESKILNNIIVDGKNFIIGSFPTISGYGGYPEDDYTKTWDGQLDDIAIYNRALTQEEITALYTSTPPCTNPLATINPQGNTTFCQGGFVNLNASTGTNYTYEWYKNGQLINGATASVYQASASGNYTVKVIHGACDATSTATIVTVNPNPTATITPQGNTTFCQGGFVNLKATEGANYSYEWFNNSQLIAGATQSVYQASTNGFYIVKVKDGACSATSNSVPVIVNQYPSSDVSVSGPTTFCEGGSVTLTALGNGSFKWNNGVTSKSITVNKSGVYRVEITNNNCTSSSEDYSITVNPNPIPKIRPDGPTAFCEGGAVNLEASGGTSYKWNSGSSTPSIKVTQTGTYYVNVINLFGCTVYTSYDVNVYPNPKVVITPIPQFILHNNGTIKLSATPAGGTFKGEGVTGTSFNPSNIGLGKKTLYYNYTSTQGCSGSAQLQTIVVDSIGTKCTSYDTVTITNTINDTVGILKIKFQLTTGIKANQFTSVSVYPNPTSDVLIIDASDVQALNGYRYKMIDISGKTVYNELVRTSKTEISLKTFGKAGVYILHVVDANNTSIETRQIVLE